MASFDEAILPGKAGKVTASLRTDGLSGPVSKSIAVRTSDPERPTITLTMRANVLASLSVHPGRRLVLPIGGSEDDTVRALVRKDPSEAGPLEIREVVSTVPWLVATARKVESAGPVALRLPPAEAGDWLLEVELAGEAPPNASAGQIRFRTGLEREPEATIDVAVRKRPALSVSTPRLVLPAPAKGEPASGSAMLTVREDLDPAAIEVSATPAPFRVRVTAAGPRRFALEVTWEQSPGGAAPRDGRITASLGSERATVLVQVLSPPAAPPDPPPAAPVDGPA